jgi:hypothetical protein
MILATEADAVDEDVDTAEDLTPTVVMMAEALPRDDLHAETRGRLREVYEFLRSYVVFSSMHGALAVALWVAHTYLIDVVDVTPRLVIRSPEKQAGKSRLLEVLKLLCPNAVMTHNVSSAYIIRKIDQGRPTLLLDEYDTIFGDVSEGSETLRSILNAGYEAGSTYGRVDKNMNPRDYNAFAPVALAGIGNPPDTIADRAVVINMRRKTKAEQVKDFRVRKVRPEAKALRERLTDWAERAAPVLDLEQTQKVEGISDRQADIWEPLLAIADMANPELGNSARDACKALTAAQAVDDVDSGKALRLLRDLRTIFGDEERLSTEEILSRLRALPDSEWGEVEYGQPVLTPPKLANMLRPYNVRPAKWNTYKDASAERTSIRGYKRSDLAEAWERWIPWTIDALLKEANEVEILDDVA